jgi:integrase
MASLYRPKIATYCLKGGAYRTPDGQRVTKDTSGAVRTVTKSKKWYGRYTDGARKQVRVPLSESKETSRRMLAKLAGDAQLAGVGITDPYARHRARRLAEHLEDYRAYLAGKGDTAGHVAKTAGRIRAVLDGCKFTALDDLEATPVVAFLADLRNRGAERVPLDARKDWYKKAELVAVLGVHPAGVALLLRRAGLSGEGKGRKRRYSRAVVAALQDRLCRGTGLSTCNHYLTAVKGFTRWLARDRRIPADPLSHLARQNADVDVRRPRRALAEAAFTRFVEATAAGAPFRGLSGADRLVLYTLAANTGLRAGELASLTPRSFEFGANPTVTVEAAYSKHRRKDVQPLRGDVAAALRAYVAGKAPGEALWPGNWHECAADMVRLDLAAAGIPYQDEAGRFFDFHAVRGQFISMLAAKGVHPKVAQVLARHSTITLTMDFYTHVDVLDVGGALGKLPALPGPAPAAAGQGAGKARLGSSAAGHDTEDATVRVKGPRFAGETAPATPAERKVRRA